MDKPEPGWLSKSDMAKSLKISTQAFDKWKVEPVCKIGRVVYFDARSVLDNRIAHEIENRQPSSIVDLEPGSLEFEQYRLTKAKADAQEMENEKNRREVIDIQFMQFVFSRVAAELVSIFNTIPLNQKRKHPEYTSDQIDDLKKDVVKAMNVAAKIDEKFPEFAEEWFDLSG